MEETSAITEPGGKQFARTLLIDALYHLGGANPRLLGEFLGLPEKIIRQLLSELENERFVKASFHRRIWRLTRRYRCRF